jgi:hypothetical protein
VYDGISGEFSFSSMIYIDKNANTEASSASEINQCCGTVMIYFGSGCDFGRVLVLSGSGSRSRGRQYLAQLSIKKFVKYFFYNVRSSIISQKVGLPFLVY